MGRKTTRGRALLAVVSLLAVAAAGYTGYRYLFNRPGEAAIALIPSDAAVVVTLDTNPSENQISAFQKLGDALKREGLDKQIESGLGGLLGEAGIASEVRPYVTNNIAFAYWQSKGAPKVLALVAIKDPEAVKKALQKGTSVTGATLPVYKFGTSSAEMAVVGNYLAISADPDMIAAAERTHESGDSVANLTEYKEARAALPSDANLMVFVSPAALKEMASMSKASFPTARWMAFSAALREDGVQWDFRGPVDAKKLGTELGDIKPLSKELYRKLPAGAYGLLAYSQPAKYYAAVENAAKQSPDPSTLDRATTEFEKQTGLSVKGDILPALQGDIVVAAYPSTAAPGKSADVLVMIDSSNGANPGNLVDKLRAFMEKKVAEQAVNNNGKAPKFVESHIGRATVWSLDEASAAEMRKSMQSGNKMSPEVFGDKTINYAVIDGNVYVASSQAMLTKALLVSNGEQTLADDPAYATMLAKVDEKAQGAWLVNLGLIMKSVEPMITDNMKGNKAFDVSDVIDLFGANGGLVCYGYTQGEVGTGSLFLPLDFNHVAHAIHSLEGAHEPSDMHDMPTEAPGTMQVR